MCLEENRQNSSRSDEILLLYRSLQSRESKSSDISGRSMLLSNAKHFETAQSIYGRENQKLRYFFLGSSYFFKKIKEEKKKIKEIIRK